MKKFCLIFLISFIGYCIYTECTTPEVYVTTNIYDGYVIDDYHCGKHSTIFVDTKTNKNIELSHGSYFTGHYKVKNGDHFKVIEKVSKKINYHKTYTVYYNSKLISQYYGVRIYDIH